MLKPFSTYKNIWVEVTASNHNHGGVGWEFGTCLWSPSKTRAGQDRYKLMRQASKGDLVLHFYRDEWPDGVVETRLTGSSIVTTPYQEINREPPSAGSWSGMAPYYRIDLEKYTPLPKPLPIKKTLLTKYHDEILVEIAKTKQKSFPFYVYRKSIRTVQGIYIARVTEQLYAILRRALRLGRATVERAARVPSQRLGTTYRPPNPYKARSQMDPFKVDHEKIERGNKGHVETQLAVSDYLQAQGIEPRSPRPDEPQFDLGWEHAGKVFVAEVKSLTNVNEERQLRLGLGQVLHYWHQLGCEAENVTAVLATEREPTSASWVELCKKLGVRLVWPGALQELTRSEQNR